MDYVTKQQISKLDELMVEKYHISVEMMMEQAAYRIAEFVREHYSNVKKIVVCCGKGNNGGDGIAAARHLLNFGYEPRIWAISEVFKEIPQKHINIAEELGIVIEDGIQDAELVIDCLFGYNYKGPADHRSSLMIKQINSSGCPIISVDLPSGVDCDEGTIFDEWVEPDHILFLSLPKIGCKDFKSKKWVADIGVPKELYKLIDYPEKNYFEKKEIIQI